MIRRPPRSTRTDTLVPYTTLFRSSRNPHTRRAYARAAGEFLAWVAARGITSLAGLQPLHVAAWIEALGREVSAPTVKQQLAAVRSEERRVGKECVSTCRSRWSPYH